MSGLVYLDSPLGTIRIEDDGQAITTIHFENEAPSGTVFRHSALADKAAGQIEAYFAGNLTIFDFPFYQPGTGFQQRVWAQLLQIPCGKTISYLELAHALEDEKCIRAAASANGKNSLAIVVPCHRVIGSGGKLVGYAGGLWRKQWLLAHEAKMAGKSIQGSLF